MIHLKVRSDSVDELISFIDIFCKSDDEDLLYYDYPFVSDIYYLGNNTFECCVDLIKLNFDGDTCDEYYKSPYKQVKGRKI